MEKYLKKYYRWFFAIVALLLLYPTLQKGYIFALDWIVEPNISWGGIHLATDGLGWIIYKFLAVVFSFGVFQRILLFAIVFFLGLAGFHLAKQTKNIYAQYFSGLFFIFNPFVYARLVEQINVIGGVVLFFWFLVYFLEYLENKKIKTIILSSILAALAISFFPHCGFFVAASFLIIGFFNIIKKPGAEHSHILENMRMFFKTALVFGAIVLILNGNWLLALAKGSGDTAIVGQFSLSDWKTFKTRAISDSSVYTTVLAMQGYWGEYQDRFISIRENPLWLPAFLLIFILAIYGLAKIWGKNDFAKPLSLLFAASFILAIGIASPLTKPVAMFLYNHVPFYAGLREPQKWVVIMVFVYAFFASWGIKYLLNIKSLKNYQKELGIFLAILPIIFSFSIVSGLHAHFAPRDFPSGWYDAKNYLDKNSPGEKTLFFPWHSYMNFGFAGKNIINPAQPFFGKNILQANNTEFGEVYSHFSDPQTLTIEKYTAAEDRITRKTDLTSFQQDMAKLGIKKIILDKDEDWQKYAWLDTIGAQKILENNSLIIYDLQ